MERNIENIFKQILDAAFCVHAELGVGLLENVYEKCLAIELRSRGLSCGTQVPVPVIYKGEEIDLAYRADLIVENQIIVEIKSVSELSPVYTAQLLNYLKLRNAPLGLLVNFNVPHLRDGIKRIINQTNPSRPLCSSRVQSSQF